MKKPIVIYLVTLTLVGCSAEAKLQKELSDANYCEAASDCVMIGSKCPFDCFIYVNKDKADELKTKVDAFQSQCEYSCLASTGVECQDNKCVVQHE